MAHDVFVSHSSKDKTTADAVCAVLESKGIRCWVAPRDIVPGQDWGESIVEAIKGARVMVLVFSTNANNSQQIKREVERAVNKGIPIIPLRIEDVVPTASLEYFLSTPHWLDAFTPPLENHLHYLAQTIRQILGDPAKAGQSGATTEAEAPNLKAGKGLGGGSKPGAAATGAVASPPPPASSAPIAAVAQSTTAGKTWRLAWMAAGVVGLILVVGLLMHAGMLGSKPASAVRVSGDAAKTNQLVVESLAREKADAELAARQQAEKMRLAQEQAEAEQQAASNRLAQQLAGAKPKRNGWPAKPPGPKP
jgi:hypothetical protein